MTITEQQVTPPDGTNPTAPAFDYNQMGAAIAQSMRPLLAPQQAAPNPVSAFQEAVNKIRANEGSDPESINVLTGLFEAHKADMSQAQEKKIGEIILGERARQARNMLDAEISRAVESNEKLGKFAPAVKVLAAQEFDNAPEMQVARDKALRGELDASDVRKIVNKHFNTLAGDSAKPAGLSGMTSENVAAGTSKASGDGNVTFKDLNDNQRELYYSIKAEYDRVGQKRHGLKPEEVESNALQRAAKRFR